MEKFIRIILNVALVLLFIISLPLFDQMQTSVRLLLKFDVVSVQLFENGDSYFHTSNTICEFYLWIYNFLDKLLRFWRQLSVFVRFICVQVVPICFFAKNVKTHVKQWK